MMLTPLQASVPLAGRSEDSSTSAGSAPTSMVASTDSSVLRALLPVSAPVGQKVTVNAVLSGTAGGSQGPSAHDVGGALEQGKTPLCGKSQHSLSKHSACIGPLTRIGWLNPF